MDPEERSSGEADEERAARAARAARALRATNRRPGLVRAVQATREMLPGHLGDQPSTIGERPSAVIARYLIERDAAEAESTVSREAGAAALQLWQALSERVGRGAGMVEATILFTDLVGFSSWVLSAGDELALELLRAVASVVEPAIAEHRGRLVKRLGDGHMAVFGDPRSGVDAALAMHEGLASVEVEGHRPSLRAGLHRGQPRKLGGDYLGTDVNIAARVSAAAGAGEVLVSDALVAAISDVPELVVKRRRGFKAKGAPRDMDVYVVCRSVN